MNPCLLEAVGVFSGQIEKDEHQYLGMDSLRNWNSVAIMVL